MVIKVKPSEISGRITAPPSKSEAHRKIILAALSKGVTGIVGAGLSADERATLLCVEKLGATVCEKDGKLTIEGIKRVPDYVRFYAGESGATLRFIMPVAAALGADAEYTGAERLFARPQEQLVDVLLSHGMLRSGLELYGKLKGGKFEVDGSVSSQYISGLLLACPLLKEDSEITVVGKSVSADYVAMTVAAMKEFGMPCENVGRTYYIKGGSEYKTAGKYFIRGDWSGAAAPLVMGALGGKVTVSGIEKDSLQGDRAITEILAAAGAKVVKNENSTTVSGGRLRAFQANVENCIDLAPSLAVVAAYAQGVSTLFGTDRLRYKESDREKGICEMLAAAGIRCETGSDSITIVGGRPKGARFSGNGDHRMVMAETALALFAEGDSEITCAEAVEKSYPAFFDDVKKLGGKISADI